MNLGHIMLILTHGICRGHAVIKILNGSQALSQSAIPILPIMGNTRVIAEHSLIQAANHLTIQKIIKPLM